MVMNLSGTIKIAGINFRLSGEMDRYGIVRLNYTHSYTSDIIMIPVYAEMGDAHTLLLTIMNNFNRKLSISQSDPKISIHSTNTKANTKLSEQM